VDVLHIDPTVRKALAMRATFFFGTLCLLLAACSSESTTGSTSGTSGTSSSGAGTSGSGGGAIVDKVAFDTKGCVGAGAASESQSCFDWAYDYALTKTSAASSQCQSPLACKTAQKGCRLYVDCGSGIPPVCTDLDPNSNTAQAQVPFAGETYACSIGYTSEPGGRRLFNLTCKSPSFNCVYKVN